MLGKSSSTMLIVLAIVVVLIAMEMTTPAPKRTFTPEQIRVQVDAERAYDASQIALYTPPGNGNASFSLSGACNKGYEKLRSQPGLAEAGSAKTGVPPDQLRTANQISQTVFCGQIAVAEKIASKVWSGIKSIF